MKTAIATMLYTVLVSVALGYTASAQQKPASNPASTITVDKVISVFDTDHLDVEKAVVHQSNGYKLTLVCYSQRADCQKLEVGKTYRAGALSNDRPHAYPYHKNVVVNYSDAQCTETIWKSVIIGVDPIGDKVREQQMSFGHTAYSLVYGVTALPDGMDKPCVPFKK